MRTPLRSALTLLSPALFSLTACQKDPAPQAEPSASSAAASSTKTGLLQVGQEAPQFTALAHTGETLSLAALRGKHIVLYFYPRDDTPGCTAEAQGFRDHHENLLEHQALILGVSTDDLSSHQAFAEKHQLPFLLLTDPDRKIGQMYGVGSTFNLSQRVTFLIDCEGKIAQVYTSIQPDQHAAEVLRDLQKLPACSN